MMTVQEIAKQLKSEFPGPFITRPQIGDWAKTQGIKIPEEIWAAKIGHGKYSMDLLLDQPEGDRVVVEHFKPETADAHHQEAVSQDRKISVFDFDGQIPPLNPNYVPWGNYKDVEKLVVSNHFFTAYITGDSGTGKNAMVEHICAKHRRPMVRVGITQDTKEEHLMGSRTLIDGTIFYEEGPVVWCAEHGAILILDEVSAADSNEILCLQNVMEGGEFFVKSLNKVIKPKPGFAIIACDNTKGQGSDSGRFIGTNVLNAAFLDRFEMMIHQDYPPLKVEKEILTKEYARYSNSIDEDFIDRLVNWTATVRKTYQNGGLDDHITTRRALKIVKSRACWFNERKAVEFGTRRFDDETAYAMITIWDKFREGQIQREDVNSTKEGN